MKSKINKPIIPKITILIKLTVNEKNDFSIFILLLIILLITSLPSQMKLG